MSRLLSSVAVLLVVTATTFAIFRVLPAKDPAAVRAGAGAPPELLERIRAELALERPVAEQYARWLQRAALHGDLGVSYRDGAAVTDRLRDALPPTLWLGAGGLAIALGLAVPLALLAVRRPRGVADRVVGAGSLAAFVLPGYLAGVLALFLLAEDVGLLPLAGGAGTYVPPGEDVGTWARSLVLPWIVVALPLAAVHGRLLRALLAETLTEDHVIAARAAGLPERRILLGRALRPAAAPFVSAVALDAAALIGGVALEAVREADLPVIEALVLGGALVVLAANLAADLLQAAIDPRVRSATAR